MITEGIIITIIICVTILIICFIIGHYTNKETKEQKLEDIGRIIINFRNSYIIYDDKIPKFIGNSYDIINVINTIREITC